MVVIVLVVLWLLSRCTAGPSTVRVAAVGDMVCDPADPNFANTARDKGDNCRHGAVSDLAVALQPAVFLGLGDFQYELPKAAAYRSVYQQSYGRLYAKTIPVFGNQEYKVQDANTFTDYFGSRILDPKGYWSQEVGRWHVVVLNSNCAAVAGGCGTGSPQQEWLSHDLQANGRKCVLAAWHHPRWSTGIAGHDPRTADLYQTLYDHGVELVLSGHDADYERFGPLDPAGKPDDKGVRQFVIGTGGQAHYRPVESAAAPAGEFADYDHHGVLELNLAPDSYDWKFHVLEGESPAEDAGRASCH
ncbi:metallophosphoesterase family protein [Symbioplanes lichenis]|uniref:metallophosphoesterase family protein n=1 Tax=Symbioplanes lichenis TaxID=1629072 RepID=UPI0027390D57|nr:metallophosphoesterase [Actinoplanes lichenis]